MKNLRYLWWCFVGIALTAQAQNAGLTCGNGRYSADVFGSVSRTADVVFGSNTTIDYSTGTESAPAPLRLDFYEPANDLGPATQRPLLILGFGGAFVEGSRRDADIVNICEAFARKGYVTAAIDYRLVNPGPNNLNYALLFTRPDLLADELVRAANDMRAAVRFFRYDAAGPNTYRIDPTKIFVGGFSAGAITALQVGYTDAATENSDLNVQAAYARYGGLEGNTDLPGNNLLGTYNSQNLAGVFNIAGGVNDLGLVSAGNPPLFSAQGTKDDIVPYDCDRVSFSAYVLCGSHQLQARATAVGIPNQLHPVVGGDHGSPGIEPDRSQIIAEAATFLQAIICPSTPLPVALTSFKGQASPNCAVTLTWQTATETNSLTYEVQASADGQAFVPLGTVPSRNQPTGAAYTYAAGTSAGTRYFRLKMLDADGTFTYSPVLMLAATCGGLTAAPNPAQNQLVVSGLPEGRSQLLLYDATGQLVLQVNSEATVVTLSLDKLPAGIYFLKTQRAAGQPGGSLKVLKQ